MWTFTLLPWVQDKFVYDCKSQLGGYVDANSYVPNGYWYMFWAEWLAGAQRTFLSKIKQPSRVMLIREGTEDWVLGELGVPGARA